MPYITAQDFLDANLEREVIARTDRGRTGQVNETVLDAVVSRAEGIVNGHLRGAGYDTPLSDPVSPVITTITLAIARYVYWAGSDAPEEVSDRYRNAMTALKDIGAGRLALELGESDAAQSAGIEISGPDRVFDDDGLEGF